MSFTKVTSAGIGSTELVTLDSLEVINNASIGGVLTYEDVTNVDSIGIITARAGVLVGSGITLSKDGDIFATGVTTATTFVGALTGNVTGNISGGTVSGSTGTFTSNVTVGGNISIPDKIIHTDDTNTSIRFPASDKVTVETAGTERLAIEPAGNIDIAKSVAVGAALSVGTGYIQVGSASSTSTFIDKGFIELTRSSGDSYIDFKDAFADDFDSRIITSGAKQLQFFTGGQGASLCCLQTGTGKVGIATDAVPTVAKLQIHSDKLGGTAGNTQELLYLTSPDNSNSTTYRFTNYRHTDGTSHTQSEGRLRRHVDVTNQGFLGLGDGYVNFGYGTAEKARITSAGKFGLGLINPTGQFAVSDGTVIGEINPYSSSSTCFIGTRSNHSVTLKTNATGRLTISTDGYVTTPAQPYCMVGRGSAQSIPGSQSVKIIFDTEAVDRGGNFNTSNSRFTAPVAGDYLIALIVQYTQNVNQCHAGIWKNGGTLGTAFDNWVNWGDDTRAAVMTITLPLAASDYIEPYTYHTMGSNMNLEASRTKMTIRYLG